MEDYRKFLKTTIFVEKSIISYRLLSRKLKVHVNQAKEMLYDFHTTENARKPNCVHATYIITGFRKPASTKSEDEDTVMEMEGSPCDSSLPATQKTPTEEEEKEKKNNGELIRGVELCQQEELEAVKSVFEKISSVHIYSLEPVPLKDLSTLTGCSADVLEISQKEDMLKMGVTYGTILNPSAKRTGSRGLPPALAPELKKLTLAAQEKKKEVILEKETKPEKKDTKAKIQESKVDEKETKAVAKASTASSKKKTPVAAAKLKRGQSNLFASWGNAPKKSVESAESASEPNSAAQSPKTADEEPDVKMESDDDDDEIGAESPLPARDNAEDVKKRKERDDELRRMMDDEDEDTKMSDDEPLTKVAKTVEASPEAEEPTGSTADVTTTGGRRRGKRKVMKRVQSRDNEGYLVTKTEAVWESFSEDEPGPPPKPKLKAAAKGKKGAMTGQGNIMSFFGKK